MTVRLVAPRPVSDGETRAYDAHGPTGLRFTLGEPFSALLRHDERVIQKSTPIQLLDPAVTGRRDTLVLTFRAWAFKGPAAIQ